MYKRLCFLISIVLLLTLAPITYGLQMSDFEDPYDPNHDGWEVFDIVNVLSIDYNDTFGVTSGSYSLRIDVNGHDVNAVSYSLIDHNLVDQFQNNDYISVDITRLASEWSSEPNSACYFYGYVHAGAAGPNEWELWGSMSQAGKWWSALGTRTDTFNYYYSQHLSDINFANLDYLDIVFVTQYDPNYFGGIYYLDNVKMLKSPLPYPALIGDFEDTMDGWEVESPVTAGYSTTGATLNNKSLRIVSPGTEESGGWDNALYYDVMGQDRVEQFQNSQKITIDITRLVSDWVGYAPDPDPDQTIRLFLCVNWSDGKGVRWDTLGESAIWIPSDGDQTKTFTYYYADSVSRIDFDTLYYLSLYICTDFDPDYEGNGIYYIDNIRMYIVGGELARTPSPENGDTGVRIDPVLTWESGMFTDKHDVYFGTTFNDVNDANRTTDPCDMLVSENQDPCSYVPGILEFNTTYYWRIDEVNLSEPNIWKGPVWSFATGSYLIVEDMERYTYPSPTADSNITKVWHDGRGGSDISISSSSYTAHQEYGTVKGMYYSYNNNPAPYYSEADANTTGTNSLNFGIDWRFKDVKALSLWLHGIPDLRGSFTGTDPYTIVADGSGIRGKVDSCYFVYREVALSTCQVVARVDSLENTSPWAMAGVMMRDSLGSNSKFIAVVVTPGNGVVCQQRRNDGNSYSNTVSGLTAPLWVRITRLTDPQQDPFVADYSTNGSTWTGIAIVPSLKIIGLSLSTPIDLGICTTSNSLGDMCTAEISNVSMQAPLGTPIADPAVGTNIGNVYNDAEKMYVVLQDSDSNAIWYYPGTSNPAEADANITRAADWTQWRMDLNDFTGVNLTDVRKMYIGFGNRSSPAAGGSGIVYIDDIRLYLAEFYAPECPSWPPDLVRDGDINYSDLGVIADNWLITDYNVIPVAPPNEPNLIAWYRLEQNTLDFFGVHNGTPNGIKVSDYVSNCKEGDWALDLKGDANFIDTDYNAVDYGIDGNKPRTITAWAYTRDFSENVAGIYEIGQQEFGQEFALRVTEEPNIWRAQHWGADRGYDIDFTYPSLNEWVHFAHTYDGTTLRVYADGYLVGEGVMDINTASGADAKTFAIGRWTLEPDIYSFDGIIDDVRIYNYALSQANAAFLAGRTDEFTQLLYLLLTPQNPNIDLNADDIINFKDLAEMGSVWGDKQVWPTW